MKTGQQISNNHRGWQFTRTGGGFSLAEVLIAMGIFGIGLAMTASLFPSGASQAKTSVNNVLGPLICHNGLALAKTKFHHSTAKSSYTNELKWVSSLMGNDRYYPLGTTDKKTGFIVLGRQPLGDSYNDYQFVIIAFRKSLVTNGISVQSKSGTIANYNSTSRVTFTNSDYLQIGSPVIVPADVSSDLTAGLWATIIAINGSVATLDHQLPESGGNINLYVINETNTTVNPVMSVLVARTPLPE